VARRVCETLNLDNSTAQTAGSRLVPAQDRLQCPVKVSGAKGLEPLTPCVQNTPRLSVAVAHLDLAATAHLGRIGSRRTVLWSRIDQVSIIVGLPSHSSWHAEQIDKGAANHRMWIARRDHWLYPRSARQYASAMRRSQHWLKRFSKWVRDKPLQVTRWIGSRPPRVWASIYILMIPFAGFIFWALSAGSFYDSNLTREVGFEHDLNKVESLLTVAIKRQESGADTGYRLSDTWKAYGTRWVMQRNSVSVVPGSVNVEASGDIAFTIQGDSIDASRSNIGNPFDDAVTISNSATLFLGSLAGLPVSLTTGNQSRVPG
jgi:hypothetical protein